jgi:hypothetical protein
VVSAGLRFTDIFFNNIFTDLAVGHQSVGPRTTSTGRSNGQRVELGDRASTRHERLAAITSQREQLLTR